MNILHFLCILSGLALVSNGENFDSPAVYQITNPYDHAEGPTWDGRKNILYFVDILKGGIQAYHFGMKKITKITLNGQVTPVIPAKNNPDLLLVGLNRSVVAVEWDGKKKLGGQEVLTTVSKQFPASRFNDGKADKQGRLWWGTMSTEVRQGILYQINKENLENPDIALEPVTISNGLAWNKANDKLYYIDSPTLKVLEFAYDDEKGNLSKENRTVFDIYQEKGITGIPDGMTIDDEDNLYIALYQGGAVIKVNPVTGKLLKVIPIPARDVTSVAWGGPDLDILFVTTSRISLTESQKLQYPVAGSVFAVENLKAKGLPANDADILDVIPKKVNILENIFTPEIFSPVSTEKRKVSTRNTELPLWQTLMNTIIGFF